MSSIDNRIVDMKFNNSQFKQGVQSTLDMLEKLKKGLKLDGAKDAFKGVNDEAKRFSLDNVGSALENISSKFSAFGAIGFAALQRLTNFAIDAGKKMASALVDPIMEGGSRRALNIEQAKFQFQGLGMDVTASLKSANDAVDGTAFALDEAAVVAAQFGASGMQAGEEMTAALRGISGVAAMAGSSYSDVGRVFTKVAGQGRLMGDDLNSLASRGVNAAATLAEAMGKTEEEIRKMVSKGQIDFQTFAGAMNDAFGEHATKANETYTGSLSNMRSALARIGQLWFYGVDINEQANGHYERQRRLFNALTPVINQVKNALVPLFTVINDIKNTSMDRTVNFLENLDLTNFQRFVWIIADTIKVLNGVVATYVNPIKRAFQEVFMAISPDPSPEPWFLHVAWALRDFVRSLSLSGSESAKLYRATKNLFTIFKTGGSVVKGVIRYYLDTVAVVWDLIKAFGGLLVPVIEFVRGLRGAQAPLKDFSEYVDAFFDAIINSRRAIVDGIIDTLENLAKIIDDILNGEKTPIDWAATWKWAFSPITSLIDGMKTSWAGLVKVMSDVFEPALTRIHNSWKAVLRVIDSVWQFIKPIATGIGNFFKDVYTAIFGFLSGFSVEEILATINTGVLLWFFNTVRKMFSGAGEFGTFSNIFKSGFTDSFEELTGVLKGMQNDLKANILLKIAAAIGILAIALLAMTFIDPTKLGLSVAAMAALFAMLIGTMAAFSKMTGVTDIAKIPIIAIAIGILAGAMLLMAGALKIMSTMDWNQTAVALTSFLVSLAVLTGAAYALSKMKGDIIAGAFAMNLMAAAILVVAAAVLAFGYMPADVLIQGLTAAGIAIGGLVALSLVLRAAGPNMLKGSVGLMAMAAAINMLLVPLTTLGMMPIETLDQGLKYLGILAGGMVVAGILMGLAGPGMLKGSVGLMAMAGAVNLLVPPLITLGMISWDTMLRGMVGLAGTMAILVIAAKAMSGTTMGAAGMLAMAGAVLILSIALAAMAAIDPDRMTATLKNLAIAFLIFGAAGLVMAPLATPMMLVAAAMAIMSLSVILLAAGLVLLTPALALFVSTIALLAPVIAEAGKSAGWMALLGGALIVMGIGAAAAGVGILILGSAMLILGVGLALIGVVGLIGATALGAVVMAVVRLLDHAGDLLKMAGVIALLGAAFIILGAGLVLVGVGAILVASAILVLSVAMLALSAAFLISGGQLALFIESLINLIPMIAAALAVGFITFATTVLEAMPQLIEAFGTVLSAIFTLITEKIPEFGTVVETFFMEILRVIEVVAPQAIETLTVLILALVDAIVILVPEFVNAGMDILMGIVQGLQDRLPDLVKATTELMVAFLTEIANNHGKVTDAAILVIEAFLDGMVKVNQTVINKGKDVIIAWIEGMGDAAGEIVTAAKDTIEKLLDAIDDAVVSLSNRFAQSGRTIARSIISGLTFGLVSNESKGKINSAGFSAGTAAIKGLKSGTESKSPSKAAIRIGGDIVDGLVIGMSDGQPDIYRAGNVLGKSATKSLQDGLSTAMDFLHDDFRPTIRPVLDLSDVEAGAGNIARLFGTPRSEALVRSNQNWMSDQMERSRLEREAAPVRVDSGTTISLVQNNNSPKALSRIDIYRQTKNLLNTVKELPK